MSELYDILVETPPTKVILLALDQGLWDCERSLAELSALCKANHMEAVAEVTQKRQTPETGIVLGSGKLEEAHLAAEELGAQCAVFDGELTGSQIRNISSALGGLEVIDRTMLILEIFRSRAVTNEGKLQTELALLRYRLPRLQGMGEALSRQGGGGGGGGGARRGAGETKLELDRRHVHARIDALAEKLAEMEKRRGESRKARAKTGMPVVSLVGYTNVGKSSLMNALCGPSVAEADMLFATLDPTSRKLVLPSGMAVLLVDTVGFVSRLPHNLVEAFKSTLEEAAWSDVIVRVADAGDEQREEQLAVTDEVLDGLDCADIPRLTVYNKCDKPNALNFDPDILLTSAKTGYGLDKLLAKIARARAKQIAFDEVFAPEVSAREVEKILGMPKFLKEEYEVGGMTGVVTGLAWTEVGGDILYIESVLTPGKGKVSLTGNLGDVMKESATIAHEWVMAHSKELGIDPALFEKNDINIHVPEGAIPKDGPSAGITMVTSIVSTYTGRKVRDRIAMTGETTLRGRVMPVGGVKEKILAAKRAGINELILSEENRKDIAEIKPEYIDGLTFHYVKTNDEVLKQALI